MAEKPVIFSTECSRVLWEKKSFCSVSRRCIDLSLEVRFDFCPLVEVNND